MSSSSYSIQSLRGREYESRLNILEEIDSREKGFFSFLAGYQSDGLNVFTRINLPMGPAPDGGFPILIFAHGFSPDPLDPNYFQRPYYETWLDAYSLAGYVVIMPGYRGHGIVGGQVAEGSEYHNKYSSLHLTTVFYAVDVLNLLGGLGTLETAIALARSDISSFKLINTNRLFLAAHSMGGDVALKLLAVTDRFGAASIWAGVCAGLEDIADFYVRYEQTPDQSDASLEAATQEIMEKIEQTVKAAPFQYEQINEGNGLDYLENLSTPLILHHGTGDTSVPAAWSVALHEKLKELGKPSILHLYEGNDHELSLDHANRTALKRDTAFFQKHT